MKSSCVNTDIIPGGGMEQPLAEEYNHTGDSSDECTVSEMSEKERCVKMYSRRCRNHTRHRKYYKKDHSKLNSSVRFGFKTKNEGKVQVLRREDDCCGVVAAHNQSTTTDNTGYTCQNGLFSVDVKVGGDKFEKGVDGLEKIGNMCSTINEGMKSVKYPELPPLLSSCGLNDILCRLEDLTAVVTGVVHAKNLAGMVSVIHLYARTIIGNHSLALGIIRTFTQLISGGKCDIKPGNSTGEIDVQSGDEQSETNVFKAIRKAIFNWKDYVASNPLAKNITNAISALISLGFFPQAAETHKDLLKSFSIKAWNVQKKSVDFFSMLIETTLFFCERFFVAFQMGDPSFLWKPTEETEVIDVEYSTLLAAEQLAVLGKIQEMREQGINGIEDYRVRIDNLIKRLTEYLAKETKKVGKPSDNPALRQGILAKLLRMKQLSVAMLTRVQGSSIREAPFAINLFGPSSTAKTQVTNLLMKCVLSAGGYPHKATNISSLNEGDKYDSDVTNETYGLVIDDSCNTKSQFIDRPPSQRMIEIINNAPRATLQADVEKKNKIFWNPKSIIVNTNVKTLLAEVFSNCPESILRRFNLFITVKLNPDYVDPDTGGPNADKMADTACPNAWLFTAERVKLVRRPIVKGKLCDTFVFETLFEDKPISHLMPFVYNAAKRHFANQGKFVKVISDLDNVKICEHGMPSRDCPFCFAADGEHTQEQINSFCARTGHRDISNWSDPNCFNIATGQYCLPVDATLYEFGPEDIASTAPVDTQAGESVDGDPCGQDFWMDKMLEDPWLPYDGVTTASEFYEAWKKDKGLTQTILEIEKEEKDPVGWMARMSASSITKFVEEHRVAILAGTVGIAGLISALYLVKNMTSIFGAFRSITQQAGDSDEDTDSSSLSGDDDDGERPDGTFTPRLRRGDTDGAWKKFSPVHIEKTPANRNTTTEDLCKKVEKLQAYVEVDYICDPPKRKAHSNIFPLKSNVWLINGHILSDIDDMTFTVKQHNVDEIGKGRNFRAMVDKSCFVKIPDTDFAIVRLTSGGDVPNMLKHFTTTKAFDLTSNLYAHTFYRTPDGEMSKHHVKYISSMTADFDGTTVDGLKRIKYPAVSYNYGEVTRKGLCMMTHVIDQRHPTLGLFHCAGKSDTCTAVAGIVSQGAILESMKQLDSMGWTLQCHSTGVFNPDKYGFVHNMNVVPRRQHCVNFMEEDEGGRQPSLEYMGCHTTDTIRFKSRVCKTMISDDVDEIMNIPKQHGPPSNKHIWKHPQRDMSLTVHPRTEFSPRIMDYATRDFLCMLDQKIDSDPEWLSIVKPLPWEYNINGYAGIASYNAIDKDTSMGPPICKPKKNFLVPIGEQYPGINEAYDFEDPQFKREVERFEEVLASGERIHTHFRACLKDEAVKYGKDKIRVFNSGEVAYLLLVRKYLLPVVRLIQEEPTIFEMAVGINSHSVEWDTLRDFLAENPEERTFAGDYKAYDKTICPEVTSRAARILEYICEKAGYSERQLRIVRGILTEVIYPVLDYVGVFFKAFGSNPSGHPLTVILNGLSGSLYLRYVYYYIKFDMGVDPLDIPLFHLVVKLLTYGDDNIGTVAPEEEHFNHTLIAQVLGASGVEYTMADKTSESVPFIHLKDSEFLKRGWLWNPDLQHHTANLSVTSIAKSLHNYMKNKKNETTEREICANALRSALIEFFYHGKEEFLKRRGEIELIIEKHELGAYINHLYTYEELCNKFLGKGGLVDEIVLDLEDVDFQ
jgi:hypothetical protein